MDRARKLAALRRVADEDGYLKGDELVLHCMNPKGCRGQHPKKKLSINLITDAFHCWVCGWGHRSSILPILEVKGETEESRAYKAEAAPKEKAPEKEYDPVRLPKEFRSLSATYGSPYYRQAMRYLADRGVGSDDILVYKLGYCEDGPYANRIIIPSFDGYGELNFFVGRAIFENSMKYKHGNFSKDIIFNEYMIDWDQPITLVEGPFDAIKAGYNAIPLQGTQLREDSKLFRKIVGTQKMVFVALDKDAPEQRYQLGQKLMKYGVTVGYLSWDKQFKDPGEMTKEQFRQCYLNPLVISDALAAMKMRLTDMSIHSGSLTTT